MRGMLLLAVAMRPVAAQYPSGIEWTLEASATTIVPEVSMHLFGYIPTWAVVEGRFPTVYLNGSVVLFP